jgi:hypothetical protein
MPASDDPSGRPDGPRPAWRHPGHLAFLAFNVLSLFGFLLVGIGLILLVTFGLFVVVSPSVNPYFGIVGYMILPMIFIAGLVIVPAGMAIKQWRLRRRVKRHPEMAVYPRIDLNDPRTRRSIAGFAAFSCFVVLPILGVSSYYGYHWTDSVEFCGLVCHRVMKPQYTAYIHSPHARVACAGCHIGPGASWFVKSKITGVGQVIAVARNSYPRPIPNAITNLRPARETCEECHWPEQFFGYQYKRLVHFTPDKSNTRRVVSMFLKTGGADRLSGRIEGIHMHMVLYGRIDYVAVDPDLQIIPWVRYTLPNGLETIYRSDGQPADAPAPTGLVRRVDCMDCHNLAAHRFSSPQEALDLQMSVGRIDTALPYVKQEAVASLLGPYTDDAVAAAGIERHLTEFYRRQHPDIWSAQQKAVQQAVTVTQAVYDQNFFPYMREDWLTYPDNVGHLYSAGCFRCHDGRHVAGSGLAISSSCSTCHIFLNPVPGNPEAMVEGEFHHPMSLLLHERLRCSQCHTGGVLPSCRDCHATAFWLQQRGKGEFRPEGGL